jgi:hypothetical protein
MDDDNVLRYLYLKDGDANYYPGALKFKSKGGHGKLDKYRGSFTKGENEMIIGGILINDIRLIKKMDNDDFLTVVKTEPFMDGKTIERKLSELCRKEIDF